MKTTARGQPSIFNYRKITFLGSWHQFERIDIKSYWPIKLAHFGLEFVEKPAHIRPKLVEGDQKDFEKLRHLAILTRLPNSFRLTHAQWAPGWRMIIKIWSTYETIPLPRYGELLVILSNHPFRPAATTSRQVKEDDFTTCGVRRPSASPTTGSQEEQG